MRQAHAATLDRRRPVPARRLDRAMPTIVMPSARKAANGLRRALSLAIPVSAMLWLFAAAAVMHLAR